ncbi:MAG: glycosyltransferase, partial [Candidatus Nezhaarchaeales archaeon]
MNSIAFVTELFYPSIGGQEFRFLRLASGLARRGFNVTVYTTDHTGGSLPREEVIEGVHVIRYVVLKNYVKPGSRALTQVVKFAIATRKLVLRLIAENDFILVNQMPILHLFFTPRSNTICIDWCEAYRKGML